MKSCKTENKPYACFERDFPPHIKFTWTFSFCSVVLNKNNDSFGLLLLFFLFNRKRKLFSRLHLRFVQIFNFHKLCLLMTYIRCSEKKEEENFYLYLFKKNKNRKSETPSYKILFLCKRKKLNFLVSHRAPFCIKHGVKMWRYFLCPSVWHFGKSIAFHPLTEMKIKVARYNN